MNENEEIARLMEIVRKLRAPDGCPWDRAQTHESLRNEVLEEAYETAEAIDNGDPENLCEELGDMLLHVAMHSVIAEEAGEFDLAKVARDEADKMVFRHPHVFGEKKQQNGEAGEEGAAVIDSPEKVLDQWEKLKATEKHEETASDAMLRVAKALPALTRAQKIQKKASKVGYDFANLEDVFKKVYEELDELKEAIENSDNSSICEEFGDVLFSCVNIARFLDVNAEFSLTKATNKFINRFVNAEAAAQANGRRLADLTAQELDDLWNEAKRSEKKID